MSKMTLVFKGMDNWERPVYECEGLLYVDVSPLRHLPPDIHTKLGNKFYAEPDSPIAEGIELEFVPKRETWNPRDLDPRR